MSPSLKYYDPASSSYKYLVGTGLTQDTADARYLNSGFRNVIRNGDMSIAQRGNGPFVDGGGVFFSTDGFRGNSSGGSSTRTRVAVTPGGVASSLGATWWNRTVISGQSAAADYSQAVLRIEGVQTLAGRQVTLSFVAVAASGTPKMSVSMRQDFGTGGSPSALVDTAVGVVTLSTTEARYSLTFTLPSISGKTIGTNGNDFLAVNIWYSAGATYEPTAGGIGIQNNTFSITDIQLEAGSVATPFERLPMQQQLAWCQRYFQRIGASNPSVPWTGNNGYFAPGWCAASTVNPFQLILPVPMRVGPTCVSTAASTFLISCTTNKTPSAFIVNFSTPVSAELAVTAAGVTAGQGAHLLQNGTATAYIDCSAEL